MRKGFLLAGAITLGLAGAGVLAAPQKAVRASARQKTSAAKAGTPERAAITKAETPSPSAPEAKAPRYNPGESKEQAPAQSIKDTLTCEENYRLCMDDLCLDEKGLRANCEVSLDSFDEVERAGRKVRAGRDLYDFAKGSCAGTFAACALAERNKVETAYKAQIADDFLSRGYFDAMNADSVELKEGIVNEYIACLQPICGASFSECMSVVKFERRAPACESVLQKSPYANAIKREAYDFLWAKFQEFCKQGGGAVSAESQRCRMKVQFSVPEYRVQDGKKIMTGKPLQVLQEKWFNVGEMVECTQEYFSSTYKEYPYANQAKTKKGFGIFKNIMGAGKIVGGICYAIFGGCGGTDCVGLILQGVSQIGDGVADIMEGGVLADIGVRRGACFVDGKFVAPMYSFFRATLPQK